MTDYLIPKELLERAGAAGLAAPQRTDAAPDARAAAALSGRWVAEDGLTAVGEEIALELAPESPVEAFAPSGEIEHVLAQTGVAFSAEPPPDASELRVLEAGRVLAQLPLAAVQAPSPMPIVQPIRLGPADASFIYPVFSERFASEQTFREAVRSLYEWIVRVPPFDGERVKARFAIDAYFWATSDPLGHFRTPDIAYDCDNPPKTAVIFLGDNGVASARLRHLLLEGKFGLVLINSRVRGGAGGMPDHACPAWASITSCAREAWQAVALHEIGHSLGLADEYQDSARIGEAPRDEPNISANADPATVGWASLCTPPATAASFYSLDRQAQIAAGTLAAPDPDFVGIFQGARYRPDLFRPSWQCLMRSTATKRFCRVCARSIVGRIAG